MMRVSARFLLQNLFTILAPLHFDEPPAWQICQANAANTDVCLALVRALCAIRDETEILFASALAFTTSALTAFTHTALQGSQQADTCRDLQACQADAANTDVWLALVRALPAQPHEAELLSPSALAHTIVSIYDARVRELAAADAFDEALAVDSVFDSVASFFSNQLAGDGRAVFMQELTEVDGPVARILMSCRCGSALHLVYHRWNNEDACG
jgi:hypothetical protein